MPNNELPEKCTSCILQPIFCSISNSLTKDYDKWSAFARGCGNLAEMDRIRQVEGAGINNFNRAAILDEIYASFFSPTMLYYPSESLRRVLVDRFDDVFPEFKSDPETAEHVKWTLRIEVISKFCQLSEILAAHLLASEAMGSNFQSYGGYASKLIQYGVNDAVGLFEGINSVTDAELITMMGYPELEKQTSEGKEWILRSLFELKFDLEIIGDEYRKFKELYNAYKHGCRMLHPNTITMDGSNAAGLIMFLTKKSAVAEGGQIKMFEFPTVDFTSFFNNIQKANSIISIMLTNRRERYHIANNVSKECNIALYFSPSLTQPEEVDKGIEFVL